MVQYRPMALRFRDPQTRGSLYYQPNSRPLIGVGGNIVDIGFGFVVKIPIIFARDLDIYGETDFFDLQLNFYRNKFALDFHYQNYQGLYLANTRRLPEVIFSEKPKRPGLSLEGASLNGVYVFNSDRFSYPAIFNNSERQLKSAGSFLAQVSLKHLALISDSLIIPEAYQSHFSSSSRHLEQGKFNGIAVMPGYSYTFVAKEFYLNLTYVIGPDLQYREIRITNNMNRFWKLESKSNLRVGLGYDNDRFFAGIIYINRWNNYGTGDLDFMHNNGFIRFSVGGRLQETRWMEKVRDHRLYQSVMNLF